jgi:NitT/TauT family transport system substrate-binding protein
VLNRLKRRHLLAGLTALTMAVGSTACGSDPSPDAGEGQAEERASAKVGYLTHETVAPSLHHASEKGYWDDQGIDVELVRFDNGTQMVQALAGGSVDAAVAGAGVVSGFAVSGRGKLAVPYSVEVDTNIIYASPDSGITSVNDLKGKKVALPVGTSANVLLVFAAEANGIKYGDVNIVNTAYNDAPRALITGAVPAAVVNSLSTAVIEKEMPGVKVLASLREFYPDRSIVQGMVMASDFVDGDREAAVRLAAGFMSSYADLIEDEERQREIWSKHYQEQESFDQYLANVKTAAYPTPDQWKEYFENGAVGEWTQDVANVLKGVGGSNPVVAPEKYLDPKFYEEALSRATGD